MALSKRIIADPVPAARSTAVPGTFRSGGEVGRMHAELADRLARARVSIATSAPGERVARAVSTAGGYLLLFLAYGGFALLFWR